MNLPPAKWQGLVAVILAVGLTAAVVLLAVAELIHSGHVSTDEATLFATVLGATIGAVATYLGTRSTSGDE